MISKISRRITLQSKVHRKDSCTASNMWFWPCYPEEGSTLADISPNGCVLTGDNYTKTLSHAINFGNATTVNPASGTPPLAGSLALSKNLITFLVGQRISSAAAYFAGGDVSLGGQNAASSFGLRQTYLSVSDATGEVVPITTAAAVLSNSDKFIVCGLYDAANDELRFHRSVNGGAWTDVTKTAAGLSGSNLVFVSPAKIGINGNAAATSGIYGFGVKIATALPSAADLKILLSETYNNLVSGRKILPSGWDELL